MKFWRLFLPLVIAACGFASFASSSEYSSRDEMNERDFEAVYNFIKCFRSVPLAEKINDLRISGDIRMEWENIHEKHDGQRLRGRGALQHPEWFHGERVPDNQFDVEFNLMFDYSAECTWAVAHLEFDNNAGIEVNPRSCCGAPVHGCDDGEYVETHLEGDPEGCHGSGVCHKICLRKAYFGWNVYEECNSRLDLEVGRRHFYDVFDSRVQFRSRFDGLLFRYSNCFECVGDFYVNTALFVIDESPNHFGWAVEVGLLDIADFGVDFKYSYIDWNKSGPNRCGVHNPWGMQFLVSQFLLAYNFDPELLCSRAKVYGALLWNHKAKRREETNDKKKNFAWYVGFLVGDVCKEGDWHFDINYQHVEAQSIPECDIVGVGRGNVHGVPFTVNQSKGNTNYRGWRVEGLYALTDNLALNPSWEYSREEDKLIGRKEDKSGRHRYNKWELQAIYAF